ncbi:MAG: DNA cytosine methyltransferase [archaeon]
MRDFTAIGMFIFGGSATFGTESAGYKIDQVLEMTDNMKEIHAYHFVKNRPDIPIMLPSEWENDEYLATLQIKNIDVIYANCPCSSLSQINRNASVDGDKNVEFYRVFNGIKKIRPKSFVIENAPTLIKLGYPIIQDMIEELGDIYKFTIIRDYAGYHEVAMRRMRTLLVGWRKDVFDSKIPLLHMNKHKQYTVKDVIGDLYDIPVGDASIKNHVIPEYEHPVWMEAGISDNLFEYVPQNSTTFYGFLENWDIVSKKLNHEKVREEVLKRKAKLNEGKRIWDKSPYRMSEDKYCPSLTSVTQLLHPIHNRSFTIREYARLMGYPDDFEFYPNEINLPIIQNIAQGVPAKFIKYITTEIKESLLGNRKLIENSEDKVFIFQHHTHNVWKSYTLEESNTIKKLEHKGEIKKQFNKLEK